MYTQKFAGFSLIELIVTVVIAGILAVMAVPSFQGFLQQSQVDAVASDLYSAVRVARNEAILRNKNITLCLSSNLSNCANNAGTNWNIGWIVIDNGALVRAWNNTTANITANSDQTTNDLKNIVFHPDYSLDSQAANGFTFTINQGNTNKFVIVNSLGKPRIQ